MIVSLSLSLAFVVTIAACAVEDRDPVADRAQVDQLVETAKAHPDQFVPQESLASFDRSLAPEEVRGVLASLPGGQIQPNARTGCGVEEHGCGWCEWDFGGGLHGCIWCGDGPTSCF